MMYYKYRSFNKFSEDIFRDGQLFFANANLFNDPFDCRLYFEISPHEEVEKMNYIRRIYCDKLYLNDGSLEPGIRVQTAIENADNHFSHLSEQRSLDSIYRRIQELHNSKGVLSLSSKWDNLLMWAHYSDCHRGFCLGFDWSEDDEFWGNIKPVQYQSSVEKVSPFLFTEQELVQKTMFTKSVEWAYESEFRIISDRSQGHKFMRSSLKCVYLGSMISSTDRKKMLSWLMKYEYNCEVYEASLSPSRYSLEFRLLQGW